MLEAKSENGELKVHLELHRVPNCVLAIRQQFVPWTNRSNIQQRQAVLASNLLLKVFLIFEVFGPWFGLLSANKFAASFWKRQ